MLKDKYYYKTGVKLIDMVMGGEKNVYGVPSGRIINVVGDRSSGKTFICNEIIWQFVPNVNVQFPVLYCGYIADRSNPPAVPAPAPASKGAIGCVRPA